MSLLSFLTTSPLPRTSLAHVMDFHSGLLYAHGRVMYMELCIRCYQLVFSYAFLFSTAQTRLYSIRLRTTTLMCPPPKFWYFYTMDCLYAVYYSGHKNKS